MIHTRLSINLISPNYTNIESPLSTQHKGINTKSGRVAIMWFSCSGSSSSSYASFMTFTIPIKYDYTNVALGMEHGTGDQKGIRTCVRIHTVLIVVGPFCA